MEENDWTLASAGVTKEEARITGRGRFEATAECALAAAATLALSRWLGLTSVWVLVPLALWTLRGGRVAELGTSVRMTPPSLVLQLGLGAILVAIYAAGHIGWEVLEGGRSFSPGLPAGLLSLAGRELFLVALPEELFFRGWMQRRLDGAWGRPWRIASARVGPGLLLQALLFALCHVLDGDWTRLRVGVFALLAGWLRERSGSIAPGILWHALANLVVAILAASLVR